MNIVIIGGGAAGVSAALFAKYFDPSANVTIIEHSGALLRKLAITGKGRCNLTNNCDTDTLRANITRNPRFLYGAFAAFDSAGVMSFFEGLGVPLKTERGGRVFPVSDNAGDVVATLTKELQRLDVVVKYANATEILREGGVVTGVKTDKGVIKGDRVILATGGASYPATGSNGSGYALARAAGHTIVPITPSLVPFETCGDVSALAGLALRNVEVELKRGDKTLYSERGEMLFTHFGVSGPVVLSASAFACGDVSNCVLYIDFKPALSIETLDARVLRDFAEQKNKRLKNALGGLFPQSFIPFFLTASGVDAQKPVNSVTKAERARLVSLMKRFPLPLSRTRPIAEAIVTCGGVDTREIDPRNMESKLVKGLRFAGEVIDVCALTGGFNLQIAFSTAYAAGQCEV